MQAAERLRPRSGCPPRYKDFLDSVTPAEWFESLAAASAAKKAQLRQAWEARCSEVVAHKAAAAAAKQRAEHDMQWARTQQQFERAERAHREAAAALREALAVQVPREGAACKGGTANCCGCIP